MLYLYFFPVNVPCLVKDLLFWILGSVEEWSSPAQKHLVQCSSSTLPTGPGRLSLQSEPQLPNLLCLNHGAVLPKYTLLYIGKHGIHVRNRIPFSKLVEYSLSGEINMLQKNPATVQITWPLVSVSFPQKTGSMTRVSRQHLHIH